MSEGARADPREIDTPSWFVSDDGALPNSRVAAFDAALPGTLPTPSAESVVQAIRCALLLGSEVQPVSRWERKHYFYADLPHGYQITQQDEPIARGGSLPIQVPVRDFARGSRRRLRRGLQRAVGIDRLQLEMDSGKAQHTAHPTESLFDLGRAGSALIEVVTRPTMRSADEAGAFLQALQAEAVRAGISDGRMEAGSLRCDVNVSVRPARKRALGNSLWNDAALQQSLP